MIKFNDYANENKTNHNLKYINTLMHPYRILIQNINDLNYLMDHILYRIFKIILSIF